MSGPENNTMRPDSYNEAQESYHEGKAQENFAEKSALEMQGIDTDAATMEQMQMPDRAEHYREEANQIKAKFEGKSLNVERDANNSIKGDLNIVFGATKELANGIAALEGSLEKGSMMALHAKQFAQRHAAEFKSISQANLSDTQIT